MQHFPDFTGFPEEREMRTEGKTIKDREDQLLIKRKGIMGMTGIGEAGA